ncbi:hypothetical protein C0585_06135 [Candidatus Woesearchaeota archaeon]|nr:MAG: hypothetical protein C0585_06135 [Candidatus Woesearchaeota archaeon]
MKMLTKNQEKALDLEIEKSRLNREKSMLVLNKSLLLYFSFLFVAIVGFISGNLGRQTLNILVFIGFGILFIGTWPYVKTMKAEEKKLDDIIKELNEPKKPKK